jgi:hypothetical protein
VLVPELNKPIKLKSNGHGIVHNDMMLPFRLETPLLRGRIIRLHETIESRIEKSV